MGYVIAVAFAPLLAPFLYRVLHDQPSAVETFDKFVYLAVPILVGWQVLPHAWEEQNALLILAVTCGVILPILVERAFQSMADETDNIAIVAGLSGLALHALLEGAALTPGSTPPDTPLVAAIMLHRIPMSLVIWWLVFPRFGTKKAATGIGLLVLATLAGYSLGSEFLSGLEGDSAALYQAFVSGSLIHVVFHQGRHDHDHSTHNHHHHHHG
jgi:hypothetical protein